MKCPECGTALEPGNWYCEKCGAEIRAVPEFEPEVENSIDETLQKVAREMSVHSDKKETVRLSGRNRLYVITAAVLCAAIIMLVLVMAIRTGVSRMTAADYISLSHDSYDKGGTEQAIDYMEKAYSMDENDISLLFQLSRYKRELGQDAEADEDLIKITKMDGVDAEARRKAYRELIQSLEERGETGQVRELLEESGDEQLKGENASYFPEEPLIRPVSGDYKEAIEVVISAAGSGKIYYSVNGETPTDKSILYTDPIVLDEKEIYNIRAVFISDKDVASEVAFSEFDLTGICPAEPVIMENSGEYDRATMIVAVAEEGSFIFYTTDGTDPTVESKRYTAPIPMPVGHSVFRFIAADLDGNASDIVEREYRLTYSRLVTTDHARKTLMDLLIRMDVLIDGNKQRGMDGYFEYVYEGDVEIEGAGEFYKFVETQVFADGQTKPTGLLYAVNTHDGSVHHLGYDSSGHYTLILMSNR